MWLVACVCDIIQLLCRTRDKVAFDGSNSSSRGQAQINYLRIAWLHDRGEYSSWTRFSNFPNEVREDFVTTLTTYPLIVRVFMLTMTLLSRFRLNIRHDSNRAASGDVFDKENTHKLDVHHAICVRGITWRSLLIRASLVQLLVDWALELVPSSPWPGFGTC